jgi:hypothetical protein
MSRCRIHFSGFNSVIFKLCACVCVCGCVCERERKRLQLNTRFKPNIFFNKSINFPALAYCVIQCIFLFSWLDSPSGPRPPPCRGSEITLRHTTLGRTPLDEWSARRRDLYLTTHNTHKRQTSKPPKGFEIQASERPQTHALDRAATGIGKQCM